MVKTVNTLSGFGTFVEEYLKEDSYGIGLLIGQVLVECDNIIHLARTPAAASEDVTAKLKLRKIQEWDPDLIQDQAKLVTRMLPGGLSVAGIFVILPGENVKTDHVLMCRTIMKKVHDTLTSYGTVLSNEMLFMHISSTSKMVTCKYMDTASQLSNLKVAELKYKLDPSSWLILESRVSIDIPIHMRIGAIDDSQNFAEQMKKTMVSISNRVDNAIALINGQLRQPSHLLVNCEKHGNSSNSSNEAPQKSFKIDLIMEDLAEADSNTGEIKVSDCCAKMQFKGTFHARAYVDRKASVDDAVKALKLDVLRSLYSRIEMHCESFPVIEDEQGASVVHELPYRIFMRLPQSGVTVSDYLFPGESAEDSLNSLEEILDVRCSAKDVDDSCEKIASESDIAPPTPTKVVEKSPANVVHYCSPLIILSIAIAIAAGGVSLLFWGG